MGVIDELSRKLATAKRAEAKAKRGEEAADVIYADALAVHRRAAERVAELERAISLLRNGLKPAVSHTGNVTPLKR
jgi:preprotein translocase subunit SecA